ncbi:MAG: CheY-like chemotaxis protein/tetratricopeptide (TPR) repeat protein [Polyangiales bacterium]|jgi:CheY-like chemotaxis protein/tetratricopeptide (TPR) repeat protein
MKRLLLTMCDGEPRDELALAFAKHEFDVTCASSGEQAIDRFVMEPFDAIAIQMKLPGRDGTATVESIRWAPGGTAVPMVLLGTDLRLLTPIGARLDIATFLQNEADAAAGSLWNAIRQRGNAEETRVVDIPIIRRRVALPIPLDGSAESLGSIDIELAELIDAGEKETARIRKPVVPALEEARAVDAHAAGVERDARLSGLIEDTSFAVVLARLAEQQATGALLLENSDDPRHTLEGRGAKKVVFFSDGRPVYVRSNLEEECLGHVLRRMSLITGEELQQSVSAVLSGQGKQGGVLITMGAITPAELRSGLEKELITKLLDLFSWDEGGFQFSETLDAPPTTVALEASVPELLLQGIREQLPIARVYRHLDARAERFVTPTTRDSSGLRRALDDGGNALLAAIDGTMSVRTLLDSGQPSRPEAAHILFAAEALGIIAFREEALHIVPISGLVLSDTQAALQSRVVRLAEYLRDGRYVEALAVSPGDSVAAAQAVSDIEEELRNALDRGQLPPQAQSAALEVLSRLPRAALAVGAENHPPRSWGESQPLPEPSVSLPSLQTRQTLDDQVARVLRAERFFRRARSCIQERRVDSALHLLQKAVAIAPDEGEFLTFLGMARYDAALVREDRMLALKELKRATQMVPKMYQSHLHYARALRDEGEFGAAHDAYARALEADPSGREALAELRELSSPND